MSALQAFREDEVQGRALPQAVYCSCSVVNHRILFIIHPDLGTLSYRVSVTKYINKNNPNNHCVYLITKPTKKMKFLKLELLFCLYSHSLYRLNSFHVILAIVPYSRAA